MFKAIITMMDVPTALYLVATCSAAQYARLGGQGAVSVWFFYLLTAALNSLFVLSYTPGLPATVQAITPALSLLGALLVPVSIAALERARQVADVTRLSLQVEVETLRGPVAQGPGTEVAQTPSVAPAQASEALLEGPPESLPWPDLRDMPAATDLSAGNTSNMPVLIYRCKHCGKEGLTKSQQLEHGRRHARERQAPGGQ